MMEQTNVVQLQSDDLFMHSSLPPATKHIQVINYKKRWNLHKKQPNCLKRCSPCEKTAWKKLWNQRWRPRSGCDGRIMAKFLIITIQVNLVPIPSEAGRRQHKFAWIVIIKNFAIILASQPLLGHQLWFHNFFHAVFFCMGRTFLLQFGCFCVDYST